MELLDMLARDYGYENPGVVWFAGQYESEDNYWLAVGLAEADHEND